MNIDDSPTCRPPEPTFSLTVTSLPPEDEALKIKALALAETLQLWQERAFAGSHSLVFVYTADGLELRVFNSGEGSRPTRLATDFVRGNTGYRRLHGGGIHQPLARAVGLKPGYRPTIVDCTAGLGVDSFILASLGSTVTMIERSPIIGALLADGLQRAASHPTTADIMERIELRIGNSCGIITTLPEPPATIYLDPMYPHRRNSALNKQEMRIIRAVVGDDQDSAILLEQALKIAANRVVVKRPKDAPEVDNRRPSHIIEMKNSRFDVYMI
jgi:16S rRNA (guanine1516-N2)-methyltransferase